jgi:hypothetical protein
VGGFTLIYALARLLEVSTQHLCARLIEFVPALRNLVQVRDRCRLVAR